MKIVVDYDLCASHGVCMGIVPEVFDVRDDGFMYVLDEHPPEPLQSKLRQAATSCPNAAISLLDKKSPF